MTNDYLILIILLLSPAILMLVHIIFIRLANLFKISVSCQLLIILTELLLNIPILAAVYSLKNDFNSLAYTFIVYNCLGYAYFHFFNISETARRIRILLEIKEKKAASYDYLINVYEKKGFNLNSRLTRLIDLGQIEKINDKYVLSGKILLVAALFIKTLRKIIGFSDQGQ